MNDVETIEVLATLYPKDRDHLWSDECDLYDFVEEKLTMDKDKFCEIVELLVPLASRWKSPITDIIYSGFVDAKREVALIKKEWSK